MLVKIKGLCILQHGIITGLYRETLFNNFVHPDTAFVNVLCWGRYIAYAFTPDNKDVKTEMPKAGMAWQFIEYDQLEKYIAAESQARKSKKGLWSDSYRIAPWEFRKKKK